MFSVPVQKLKLENRQSKGGRTKRQRGQSGKDRDAGQGSAIISSDPFSSPEISLDENENGIPDECEGEERMYGEGTGDPEAVMQAWADFYEWADQQPWGPDCGLSGAEQFQSMVDKLLELGLPVQYPLGTAQD